MLVRKESKIYKVENKKLCKESIESKSRFDSSFEQLKSLAKRLQKEFGKQVTDEMIVVFWAKDDEGTPVLVKGAYNYWTGDEELTMTEIAKGAYPSTFMKNLDAYVEKEPEFISEYLSEEVANGIIDAYDLEEHFLDLQKVMWKRGAVGVDYKALYKYMKDKHDIKEDFDDFLDTCYDLEADHDVSIVEYGWNYSTKEQGNFWYGRSNHVKGPVFGEVISIDESQDIVGWGGYDLDNSDINEKGVRRLARNIKNGTTERPRY